MTSPDRGVAIHEPTQEQAFDGRELLRLAGEAAQIGFWLWHVDSDRFETDERLPQLLGLQARQRNGSLQQFLSHLLPESRDRVYAAMRRALARNEDFRTDFHAVHASGAMLGFQMRGTVTTDADGRRRMAGAISEATELLQIRAEVAAKSQQVEQHLFAFRAARMGAWTLHLDADGLDGHIDIDRMGATVMGYSQHNVGLRLSTWMGLIHPDDRERVGAEFTDAIASRETFTIDYRTIGDDGLQRGIRSVGRVFRDGEGRALRVSGASFDVSAEQRALERLEASNRALDDFAYIASHDLREPLRGIHNYSRFLLEDYGEQLDDQGRGMLKTLGRLAQRLEALTTDLLSYSRLGRVELAVGNVDLQALLHEVLDSLDFSLRERKVEVRIPRPLPTLRCDRVRIAELFRNLISNAIKYNDKQEPWIEIGYDDQHPIEFYVRDNGIGIAAQHRERVFQIFKRLHERDAYGGGTGAGLAIARKIVAMHQGHLRIESEVGVGTTFHFDLSESLHASP